MRLPVSSPGTAYRTVQHRSQMAGHYGPVQRAGRSSTGHRWRGITARYGVQDGPVPVMDGGGHHRPVRRTGRPSTGHRWRGKGKTQAGGVAVTSIDTSPVTKSEQVRVRISILRDLICLEKKRLRVRGREPIHAHERWRCFGEQLWLNFDKREDQSGFGNGFAFPVR